MSLRPETRTEVPASTAAVARAAFPRGNPYLRLRDALGTVFSDAQFAPLFPSRGQPAEVPWRLALVTVLQFAENLSDRRAAEAVRGRIILMTFRQVQTARERPPQSLRWQSCWR